MWVLGNAQRSCETRALLFETTLFIIYPFSGEKMSKWPGKFVIGLTGNIATGKSITIIELINILKKDFPEYNAQIKFEPQRAGDIKFSSADTSKFENL